MATKILKSIKGKTVRLTRLDECGNVIEGSCSTLVSDCFVSVTLSGEYEAGDEFVQKNAWGELCINDKDPDTLKRVNVAIQFAEINPDALDIIAEANAVISGGDTIGASFGTDTNYSSFALEVWTKRTGVDCTTPATQEWGYFLIPFVKNGKIDGDITIENGALTLGVMGEGFPASSGWGVSPYTPNGFIEAFPVGDIFGMVVTTVQPPADTGGCVPYVAPVPLP
jgi:hypothetical protein